MLSGQDQWISRDNGCGTRYSWTADQQAGYRALFDEPFELLVLLEFKKGRRKSMLPEHEQDWNTNSGNAQPCGHAGSPLRQIGRRVGLITNVEFISNRFP